MKKYRNTENISILSSKVSTEIQPKYGISISILLWGVLFGFVIGENSFFPRTVLRILFSVFFPYIDTDSQCDDHNIRNRKRTENKHLSDDDHEQLQLSWRRLPPPCDPEGRRAGGSSFVGCPCRQRLSRAHVSPEWAEGGGPGSWAPVRRAAALIRAVSFRVGVQSFAQARVSPSEHPGLLDLRSSIQYPSPVVVVETRSTREILRQHLALHHSRIVPALRVGEHSCFGSRREDSS